MQTKMNNTLEWKLNMRVTRVSEPNPFSHIRHVILSPHTINTNQSCQCQLVLQFREDSRWSLPKLNEIYLITGCVNDKTRNWFPRSHSVAPHYDNTIKSDSVLALNGVYVESRSTRKTNINTGSIEERYEMTNFNSSAGHPILFVSDMMTQVDHSTDCHQFSTVLCNSDRSLLEQVLRDNGNYIYLQLSLVQNT